MALGEDFQFSTSHWCKRAAPKDIYPMHLKFIQEECDKNRKLIPCQLNIKYGEGKREKYDIYGTDLDDDAPIYIHVHGGFWQKLDKDISSYMVKPLYDNHYKAIIVGYDLCPNVTLPQIMVQIATAITKIMAYVSKLGSRAVYLGGHSAGAQLITSLYQHVMPSLPPSQRALIKELYLISGVYDLIPLVTTNINAALNLDLATATECSPMHMDLNVGCHTTVFNIFVGENDPPKFIEQSRGFYEKLMAVRVSVEFTLMEDCDHFSIVERMSEEGYEVIRRILMCDGKQGGAVRSKID